MESINLINNYTDNNITDNRKKNKYTKIASYRFYVILFFLIFIFLIQSFILVYLVIITNKIKNINTEDMDIYLTKFKVILDYVCKLYVKC